MSAGNSRATEPLHVHPAPDSHAQIEVAAVNPEAYIPGDRRRALAAGRDLPDRIIGAALFADVSGFTALTEVLANELGAHRGAEQITGTLNRVFHQLISVLDRYGGEVIYFSGDAITCWIDADEGSRATACGFAMQQSMRQVQEVVTLAGTRVVLAMKIAIAAGRARRFVVGDPDLQRIDVLAGRLIDALAQAEHHAHQGEVILDESALDLLGGRVNVLEVRVDEATGRRFGVAGGIDDCVSELSQPTEIATLPEHIVKQWMLPVVYERLRSRRGEFMAELRPAYPVFVRFGGIDYDNDEEAIGKLDTFVRNVQRIVTSFGGNLLHLSLGDKGAYLYGVFGAPIAHEDDAARALAACLKLRELSSVTSAIDIQIGVTYGRLRSGMYGHKSRQAFTCIGDAVNAAARLMSLAPPGEIHVSEQVRLAAGEGFEWKWLPPVTLKGRVEPLPIFALTGSRGAASRPHAPQEMALVGRSGELTTLGSRFDEALEGRGQVIGISAEAGVGKSRLLAEFARIAATRGAVVASGECQSYGINSSYFVWRNVWAALLGIDAAQPEYERVRRLERRLAAIDTTLASRAPLLSDLLDLPIPENDLTSTFDAKLRKASLEDLLARCLGACSKSTPLLIVLEDCHWIDGLSRDLLGALARASFSLPVVFALAYRPSGKRWELGIESLPYFTEIALGDLDRSEAAQFVRSTVSRVAGTRVEPRTELVDIVVRRAQGNPFYIEQLVNFIHSRGVDLQDDAALNRVELPDSLHSLILGRIDSVGEMPRQTLKVASVVGRVFSADEPHGAYPPLGTLEEVEQQLDRLLAAGLLNLEFGRTYAFNHSLTQEVVYESLPFGFRSFLHERVAVYIERTQTEAIERHLDVLAHHYWHTENLAKKREYLARAGIASQAKYANAAAIDYFERLVPLLDDAELPDVLLKLGSVLELIGNWRRADEVDRQALLLAQRIGNSVAAAACETALAEVARKQGRFDDAIGLLNRAADGYALGREAAGLGRVQHLLGTVAAQRGDYDTAVQRYERSLTIREELDDKASMAGLLSNLGVIAEYRGDFEQARQFHERAMQLRSTIGDRRAIAVSMNNLGMIAILQKRFEDARVLFEGSMLLNREVGDAWMVAICHNNLGSALRGLGDYDGARKHYAESLRSYRNYDDRWAVAFLLEDVGMLCALVGDTSSALVLIGGADSLRDAIGTPRSPLLEAEISETIAAARARLTPEEQQALRVHGRSFDLEASIRFALAACQGEAASSGD